MRLCPRCGNSVASGVLVCPFCMETLPAEEPRRRRSAQPPQAIERSRYRENSYAYTPAEIPPEQRAERPRRRPVKPRPRWVVPLIAGCGVLAALFLFLAIRNIAVVNGEEARKIRAYTEIVTNHPQQYTQLVETYAAKYNLQPAFVCAIILNESSFRPTAESGIGARGLMQLMEGTASWINSEYLHLPDYSFQKLWDPEVNIMFGCWYLRYLSSLFNGDPVLVASAYHAGQGNVKLWLANRAYSGDGVSLAVENIPTDDTRSYVRKVVRDYAIYDALYYRAFNDAQTAIVDPRSDAADPSAER